MVNDTKPATSYDDEVLRLQQQATAAHAEYTRAREAQTWLRRNENAVNRRILEKLAEDDHLRGRIEHLRAQCEREAYDAR